MHGSCVFCRILLFTRRTLPLAAVDRPIGLPLFRREPVNFISARS